MLPALGASGRSTTGDHAVRNVMHKAVKRALTAEEIQTYRRDGVVLVRELIDSDWVTELQQLVDQNIVQPLSLIHI